MKESIDFSVISSLKCLCVFFCIINYTIAINLLELHDSNGCITVPDQVKYFELVKEQLEGEL